MKGVAPMRHFRRSLATAAGVIAVLGLTLGGGIAATAYQPVQTNMYTIANPGSCNKSPCILYPKSAQLPSGRIVASFEDSEGPIVGQTLPIYKSDDYGTTWQKLTNLQAPAYLSSNPAYAPYTSAWTNPYLYVLPQAIGSMPAGTLLLSAVVSGNDTGDGQWRKDVAIALYSSSNQGATWAIQSIVVAGGNAAQDAVWEPYLMVYNNQLVAYYSDEQETNFFGAGATQEGGQILAHKTSTNGTSWSAAAFDVNTTFYSGRPGMTNIVPTTDGKWMMTFEYWGGGADVRVKYCTNPLSCDPASIGTTAPGWGGGSPVTIRLPDGRLVYNDADDPDVMVNASGSSTGAWLEYQTPVAAAYSRDLQYVAGTGRVVIIRAPWGGSAGQGPVSFAEVDLGNSAGTYYSIVNRKTGQVLSTDANKTQDANLSGGVPDLITWANNPSNTTQGWHSLQNGSTVTLLNQAGGRSVGIWTGNAVAGQRVAQWVDDGGTDKDWVLVATSGGYYKIQSVRNSALYLTGNTVNGPVTIENAINATGNAALDDSQEWQLVPR
jgi:hypothetical protein